MFRGKRCVAMLLAGGQGSRLKALTNNIAKPAVAFGGKYRLIDFTLSNCINSNIDTVGVLTQYEPMLLNRYIGNGETWGLDLTYGGVAILPPHRHSAGGDWYYGTANAVYQNFAFIDKYHPAYVLVLSGDHIYKMNYRLMIDYHEEKGAACTVAVIDVDKKEASRFGIAMTDGDGRVTEFEEKPANPQSTQASMGVYVFDRQVLLDYLVRDDRDPGSDKDFGKNIIPAMLAGGEEIYAYTYGGYWRDVGTVRSYMQAHMDLLGKRPELNLNDEGWKIYYKHPPMCPQYIGFGAVVENCLIAEGCRIEGTVRNSVLFSGVCVEKGAVVDNSVIMAGGTVGTGAVVINSVLDERVVVDSGAKAGGFDEEIHIIGSGDRVAAQGKRAVTEEGG